MSPIQRVRALPRTATALAVLAGISMAAAVPAQTTPATPAPASPGTNLGVPTGAGMRPEAATLTKLQRRMSLTVQDTRLEDVFKFIAEVSQADIEPLWTTDQVQGLDKDRRITVNVQNQAALYVVEAVLEKARQDYQENSWQLTPEGTLQAGPKDLLNKSKRLVMYDINDLLMVIPRYTEVPSIDLNSVLQQSQGGSGQSPFQNDNANNSPLADQQAREMKMRKIIEILTSTVEPNQWTDNGGEGASVREYNGVLIINAADYIHRQINGYTYWPGGSAQRTSPGGRRYLTLNMDTGLATPRGVRQHPVTAVAGGQVVPSAPKPAPAPAPSGQPNGSSPAPASGSNPKP